MRRKKTKGASLINTSLELNPISIALMYVDSLLERIRDRKLKTFESTLFTQLNKLTPPEIKKLNIQYKRTAEDIKDAISGDESCLEAYSYYDKIQLKLAAEIFKNLKKLKHDVNSVGKIRKFRTIIQKTKLIKNEDNTTLVKKVLFLEKDKETKISSLIKPEEIIGCSQLWIYNTKTRKLGCYYSINSKGLSVKGTTVLNYDQTKSTTKTIRKPKVQLKEFMGKLQLFNSEKYWENIKATAQKISPRLNRETLLLKIAKIKLDFDQSK